MSKRITQVVLIVAIFKLCALDARAQERCDSAADMVVQAREQARPDITREETARVGAKLKSATSMCSASGDAWYYRYLYSQRLGDQKDADYALTQARMFNAEGLRRRDNPFAPVLTAGAAREVKLSPIVREKWALIVGIGNFQYPDIKPLKYTAKDARDFAALLTDPAYGRFRKSNITLLTDAEFVLVKMERKSNSRETVLMEIGMFGSSTGARDKDVREFGFEKLKPGVFKVTPKVNLDPGEYCFYFAGVAGAYGIAGGKLFDFSIILPAM